MNVNAKTFISDVQTIQDAMYDELERQFVKNNKWLFEDENFEYKHEKKVNEGLYVKQVVEQVLPKKSYADITSN